ncbi:MAG: hypothetical protein K0R65_42 [Crocinitomicaceae bacterium]|nr:hypothetical protein [Crocinitomicaceae bacterium]
MNGLKAKLTSYLFTKENKHSLVYFFSAVFGAILGFLTLPYFANALSKDDIAIYGFAAALNTFFIPVFFLSFETYFIKRFYETEGEDGVKKLVSTTVLFVFGWSALIILLMTFLGPLLFHYAQIEIPFSPYVTTICLGNIFFSFFSYHLLMLRIRQQVWKYFFLSLLQNVLITGLSIALVYFVYTNAFGRILGMSAATLIIGVISLVLLRRQLSFKYIDTRIIREGVRFSVPLVMYVLINMIFDITDRFVIEKYYDLSSLANYNIAFQYASISILVSISLFKSYETELFNLLAAKKVKEVVKKMKALNLINFGICSIMMLCADFLITFLTNDSYAGAEIIAKLLLLAFFLRSVYLNCNTILSAHNKNNLLMVLSFFGLLFSLTVFYFIGSSLGVESIIWVKIIVYGMLVIGTTVSMILKKREFANYLYNSVIYSLILILLIFIS